MIVKAFATDRLMLVQAMNSCYKLDHPVKNADPTTLITMFMAQSQCVE